MNEWLRFFVIRLPLAVVAVAVGVQALAAMLSGVTLHRHNVDDLANAVMHDAHPYRVVLLGDSVTHNVAHKFRIGDSGEVADLTTHALAGLPSSLFLLKRYLESGHRPQHVVLAASRGLFTEPMEKPMFSYYVGSVFTKPDEKAFLAAHYPGYVDTAWKPAALSMTTRIGEPLFSLIRRPGNDIWIAPGPPTPHPVLETFTNEVHDMHPDPTWFQSRVAAPAQIRSEVDATLVEMCRLSHQYGFALHIIWAPGQTELQDAMKANGRLRRMDEQLIALFQANDTTVSIDDANDEQRYPAFDRDLVHIRGLGWEQTYANELTSYIHHFEAHPGQQVAKLD